MSRNFLVTVGVFDPLARKWTTLQLTVQADNEAHAAGIASAKAAEQNPGKKFAVRRVRVAPDAPRINAHPQGADARQLPPRPTLKLNTARASR